MKMNKKHFFITGIVAATLLVSAAAFTFLNTTLDNDTEKSMEPPVNSSSSADMIGLIIYNGHTYTQTGTDIEATDAQAIVGEKLGTTKGTIDEWSKQNAFKEELASTIGVADVYTVKGYDDSFRIMTYAEHNFQAYAEFYEYVDGTDNVFRQLNITGNITSAQWRTFSDWNYNKDNYKRLVDLTVLNTFIDELNSLTPISRGNDTTRNDDNFRELIVHLQDGSKVQIMLLKDGSVFYGYSDHYYKVSESIIAALWEELQ